LRRRSPGGRTPGRGAAKEPHGGASFELTNSQVGTTISGSVTVKGDTTPEADEYIVVSFNQPTNARLGGFRGLGFGVVTNDDAG
jgi:hypothetical protein